jgi:hypothetical protein
MSYDRDYYLRKKRNDPAWYKRRIRQKRVKQRLAARANYDPAARRQRYLNTKKGGAL